MRVEFDDTTCDFYTRLVQMLQNMPKAAKEKMKSFDILEEQFASEVAMERVGLSPLSRQAVLDEGKLTARSLVVWCRRYCGSSEVFSDDCVSLEALVEDVEMELRREMRAAASDFERAELVHEFARQRDAARSSGAHASPRLSSVQLGSLAECITLSTRRSTLLVELAPFVQDPENFHDLVSAHLSSVLEREEVHRTVARAERKAWLREVR